MQVRGFGVSTKPKSPGLFIRWGDVCDPRDGEQLNGPPWPSRAARYWLPAWVPLLFFPLGIFMLAVVAAHYSLFFLLAAPALFFVPGIFVCAKLGRFGFYAGWKVYGFDMPNYTKWCSGKFVSDVYEGSLAMEMTARFFTDG